MRVVRSARAGIERMRVKSISRGRGLRGGIQRLTEVVTKLSPGDRGGTQAISLTLSGFGIVNSLAALLSGLMKLGQFGCVARHSGVIRIASHKRTFRYKSFAR